MVSHRPGWHLGSPGANPTLRRFGGDRHVCKLAPITCYKPGTWHYAFLVHFCTFVVLLLLTVKDSVTQRKSPVTLGLGDVKQGPPELPERGAAVSPNALFESTVTHPCSPPGASPQAPGPSRDAPGDTHVVAVTVSTQNRPPFWSPGGSSLA